MVSKVVGTLASEQEDMKGYEICILFLIFLGFNLAWEVLIGGLIHISTTFGGPTGLLWLLRTKDELVGLGVVSLILSFVKR